MDDENPLDNFPNLSISLLNESSQSEEQKPDIEFKIVLIPFKKTEIVSHLQSLNKKMRNSISSSQSSILSEKSDLEYTSLTYRVNQEEIFLVKIYQISKDTHEEIYMNFLKTSMFITFIVDLNQKDSLDQITEIYNKYKSKFEEYNKIVLIGMTSNVKNVVITREEMEKKSKEFDCAFYMQITNKDEKDLFDMFNKFVNVCYRQYVNEVQGNPNTIGKRSSLIKGYDFLGKVSGEVIPSDEKESLSKSLEKDIKRVNQKKCCCYII